MQSEETFELPPSSMRVLLTFRGATWAVGFTLDFIHLSPAVISQVPKTRRENGQGSVGLCVKSVKRAKEERKLGELCSVFSLLAPFQGSLALEVLVITLAT